MPGLLRGFQTVLLMSLKRTSWCSLSELFYISASTQTRDFDQITLDSVLLDSPPAFKRLVLSPHPASRLPTPASRCYKERTAKTLELSSQPGKLPKKKLSVLTQALERQKQEDQVQCQPGLNGQFQVSLGYMRRKQNPKEKERNI